MKPARVLLLLVALVTGGLAAFLATRGEAPATRIVETTQIQQEAKRQVLIASATIGVGQRLTRSLVSWQDWPEGAVRPEYITSDVIPDAPEQMVGTVARFEIFAGEPIREAKLVRSDQGYLSAVIQPGMRAVSVAVTSVSGAGGYIVPNDRVDIVRTKRSATGSGTQTILANIKVLAIGKRLGEAGASAGNPDPEDPQSQVFGDEDVATLELSPGQAETIIGAAADGKLTLVLRSVADFAPSDNDTMLQASNQPIRLIRYGVESNVLAGATVETILPEADPSQFSEDAGQAVFTPASSPSAPASPLTNSPGQKFIPEDLGPDGQPFPEGYDPAIPMS
ncbi:MAG: Flp pilus assembly protein CpaB [Devosiaceae bacterium]|nr:Flp pilus assembly protein CpaB [Devosiaceae bacterium]